MTDEYERRRPAPTAAPGRSPAPTVLRFLLAGAAAAVVVAAYFAGGDGHVAAPPPESAPTIAAPPPTGPAPSPQREIVGARHVVVAWRGAERAPARVTRTKEEARARAEQALAKLRGGTPFAQVVDELSDDEATRPTGGAIGNFERGAMPAAFSDAAFALEVGALSGIVETRQGFHVIQRTK